MFTLRPIIHTWQNWWTAGDKEETMLVSGDTDTVLLWPVHERASDYRKICTHQTITACFCQKNEGAADFITWLLAHLLPPVSQ